MRAGRRDVAASSTCSMIVNTQSVPVNPRDAVRLRHAVGRDGHERCSKARRRCAASNGRAVTVERSVPAGQTFVQVACELPVDSGTMEIAQRFPATLDELAVVVKKSATRSCRRRRSSAAGHAGRRRGLHRGNGGSGRRRAAAYADGQRPAAPQRGAAVDRAGARGRRSSLLGAWCGRDAGRQRRRAAERKRLVARREKLFERSGPPRARTAASGRHGRRRATPRGARSCSRRSKRSTAR